MENPIINQNTNTATADKNTKNVNKYKKGIFPRLPLKKALELPRAIYEIGQGEPVRRLKIFDHMGKSAESGPSRVLVTVSGMYGLTKGGYQADYLELTDMGKRIAQFGKLEDIYNILFENEIFSSFVNYWKEKSLPSDDIANDWLIRNINLTSSDAKIFWEVLKDNLVDYHLTEQLSGKPVIISKEVALEAESRAVEPTETDIINCTTSNIPLIEKPNEIATKSAILPKNAVEIELENGGNFRMIMANNGPLTIMDVKQMKTQIDIFSKFIDCEK